MISLEKISVGYGKTEVLNDITLSFKKGEITTIIGTNGCGKSTLLKSVTGLIEKTSGNIFIDDKEIGEYTQTALAQKIAYLSQSKNIPDMTVFQLVLHGRFPYLSYPRKYRKSDFEIAEKSLSDLNILDFKDKPLSSLSGGERQKVYIAMALCQNTPIIVLDEPTTYLDINHQFMLCDIIKSLKEKGKTIVLVLHDIPLALKISDKICVLGNGRVLFYGNTDELEKTDVIENTFNAKLCSVCIDNKKEYFFKGTG